MIHLFRTGPVRNDCIFDGRIMCCNPIFNFDNATFIMLTQTHSLRVLDVLFWCYPFKIQQVIIEFVSVFVIYL